MVLKSVLAWEFLPAIVAAEILLSSMQDNMLLKMFTPVNTFTK
jgi:hypothetical protein